MVINVDVTDTFNFCRMLPCISIIVCFSLCISGSFSSWVSINGQITQEVNVHLHQLLLWVFWCSSGPWFSMGDLFCFGLFFSPLWEFSGFLILTVFWNFSYLFIVVVLLLVLLDTFNHLCFSPGKFFWIMSLINSFCFSCSEISSTLNWS